MFSSAVREFCQNSPEFHSRYFGVTYQPVQTVLNDVEVAASQPNMVDYLDILKVGDDYGYNDVVRLITHLPSEMILDEYGQEALAWAADRGQGPKAEQHALILDKTNTIHERTMIKTKRWCNVLGSYRGRDVVSQYMLSKTLLQDGLVDVDLPRLLSSAVNNPDVMSKKRAAKFALVPVTTAANYAIEGWIPGSRDQLAPNAIYPVWLDTPTGFLLTYKGIPQAVAGIAMRPFAREIMIHQLQGVQGKRIDPGEIDPIFGVTNAAIIGRISSGALTELDWRKVMIGATGQLAASMGMADIAIRQGAENLWTTPRFGEPPHMTRKAAITAYDLQAKRLGFKQGVDGDWHQLVGPRVLGLV